MIKSRMQEDMKIAMKSGDKVKVATLRLVLSKIKDKEISGRDLTKGDNDALSDGDILSLFQTMVKQRQQSMDMYTDGGRQELADKEHAEIGVIESYMPAPLSDADVTEAIVAAIAAVSAASPKDMGKVMAHLKGAHLGRMDFSKVAPRIKEALNV